MGPASDTERFNASTAFSCSDNHAASYDLSGHIGTDHFTPFVVKGWVEPWLPEAAQQNRVLGGAFAAAGLQFA